MEVELNKEDIKNLLMGTCPNYEAMEHYVIANCGSYIGGFVDRWNWEKNKMDQFTEQQLYAAYLTCKASWE